MDETAHIGLEVDKVGLEVEELSPEEASELAGLDLGKRWQGQLRRAGSTRELPRPQCYEDYPVWLTTPTKRAAEELAIDELVA
jgi:hypothetical protein